MSIQPPLPFLWFNDNAEDAANHYVQHIGGTISSVSRYDADSPMPEGTAFVVEFDILGQKFAAMNGGPHYAQTPATSFSLACDTQDEIDRLWTALGDGGQIMQCGWLTDRFGVTWQIVPRALSTWMSSGNGAATARVVTAIRPMVKLEIAALEAAFKGE
jgi:predicted 3-demethylubiquinone-9 3-methyltransferase (glyoxalase superfamily)